MPDVVHVGDPIRSLRVMELLPAGTRITDGIGSTWQKRRQTDWEDLRTGGRWRARDFSLTGNITIARLPDGALQLAFPRQTIEQVKWAFRTGALQAAESHSVGIPMVERALAKMGIGADDMQATLGRGVRIGDSASRDRLPDGSVIYTGTPAAPSRFAVWAKKNGAWVHVLGEQAYLDGVMTIESLGGDRTRPEWLDREGTEEDEAAIAEFKARAWRIGYDLKTSAGWCSTYEDIVHRLGVSIEDTRRAPRSGMGAGERVEFHQVPSLPLGTLLWWQHTEIATRWIIFRRTGNSTNAAQTMQIARSGEDAGGDNYKRRMQILAVADRDGRIDWRVPDQPPGIWEALPAGTVFHYQVGGTEEYVKMGTPSANGTPSLSLANGHDRRSVERMGNYRLDQFGPRPEWRVQRFIT